ncbi:hypothetical protein [Flammeovirga sp. EKP202]|uniref:hypothetical protein n=1 Tax=Flammeovirga sp. EKP202 TaxID=2770592 RepID=UPI00165F7429|nr:hypothetical protein [Flammeovirga sp. EKP202]MBD0404989.1 hypothetical protein [Flammeovirga sp. EKP202]
MYHKLLIIVFLFSFFSCENKQKTSEVVSVPIAVSVVKEEKHMDSNVAAQEIIEIIEDSAQIEEEVVEEVMKERKRLEIDSNFVDYYPERHANYFFNLIEAGSYHGDELDKSYANKQWVGVFADSSNYYLKNVDVAFEKDIDPVMDLEGDSSGVKVSVIEKDDCLFLFSDFPLEDRTLHSIDSLKDLVCPLPGDSTILNYNNTKIKLYATGDKQLLGGDFYEIANYRLFIDNESKTKTPQLLFACASFNDAMPDILWVGDIDNDGKLDFLFDLSSHYNATSLNLFLSSLADKNEFLKIVAFFETVGC